MAQIRIQKFFTDCGILSRRAAEAEIMAGRVKINGITAEVGQKIDADCDVVEYKGKTVKMPEKRHFTYVMLNKPRGYLSTVTDDRGRNTVTELVSDVGTRLYPVGRLDMDSEGLLLLTNDGSFSHSIISPKRHVAKVYRAAVSGVLDDRDIEAFAEGIVLSDGTKCMSAGLSIERPSVGLATVYEGKYHQVKRMFASRGKHVTALHRLSIGGLSLDPSLRPGDFRELTEEEKKAIFE